MSGDGRVVICILGTRAERIFFVVSILNIIIYSKESNLHIQLQVMVIAEGVLADQADHVGHYTFTLPVSERIRYAPPDTCCK